MNEFKVGDRVFTYVDGEKYFGTVVQDLHSYTTTSHPVYVEFDTDLSTVHESNGKTERYTPDGSVYSHRACHIQHVDEAETENREGRLTMRDFKVGDKVIGYGEDGKVLGTVIEIHEDVDYPVHVRFETGSYERYTSKGHLLKEEPSYIQHADETQQTEQQAKGQYLIIRQGGYAPTVQHATLQEAVAEVNRLCKKYPNTIFTIVQEVACYTGQVEVVEQTLLPSKKDSYTINGEEPVC